MVTDNDVWDIAEQAASQVASPHWANVASFNPNDHTATVQIPNGANEPPLSQELPIALMGGMRYAPRIGQQAWVVPDSQDASQLVIAGFAFTDKDRPPITNNAINGQPTMLSPGEWEAIGPNGSSVRLCTDGTIYMQSASGLNIVANLTIQGNISCNGTVFAEQTITSNTNVIAPKGTVNDVIEQHNAHTHDQPAIDGQTAVIGGDFIVNPAADR
jgi:hypothetical protein